LARLARAVEAVAAAIPADSEVSAARDVARLALADLFEAIPHRPELTVAISSRQLEVTARARGFFDVRLEEVTLSARLG
jgi:hypothetical protein